VSILPDHQIQILCNSGMITPFDVEKVNPASLDVTLGNEIMVEQDNSNDLKRMSIEDCTKEKPFLLHPGHFVLAHTVEKFRVPSNIAGQFALKSSLARAGFEHLMAGYIDPGFWDSVLTLELKNARRIAPIPLYPNMRIGQIVWTRMESMPNKTYRETGRYNFCKSVESTKGYV